MFAVHAIRGVAARLHYNAIISYINSNDYHIGIAAQNANSHTTEYTLLLETILFDTPSPSIASPYIKILIDLLNEATDEDKLEFLQHEVSRRKFFKIISGLFLHFTDSDWDGLPFDYLKDLLGILALDPDMERQFYHSNSFTKLNELLQFSCWRLLHAFELREIAFTAIQKYPSTFLDRNIQEIFRQRALCCEHHLRGKKNLLSLLKKSPDYLEGRLTNQDILEHVSPVSITLPRWYGELGWQITFYASVLVTFLEDPNQLRDYVEIRMQAGVVSPSWGLEKIIMIENELRKAGFPPSIIFDGSCSLSYLSADEQYHCLLDSLKPVAAKTVEWLPTFFLNARPFNTEQRDCRGNVVQPEVSVLYGLYEYLKEDVVQTAYKALLEQRFSPDMVARILLHDMLHSNLALSTEILEGDGFLADAHNPQNQVAP